jgi:hypothetical protein
MPLCIRIPADGNVELGAVTASGYEQLNRAVGASYGDTVRVHDAPGGMHFALWIDDEGALVDHPAGNARASALAQVPIYGDALLMATNREGRHVDLPEAVAVAIIRSYPAAGAAPRVYSVGPDGKPTEVTGLDWSP